MENGSSAPAGNTGSPPAPPPEGEQGTPTPPAPGAEDAESLRGQLTEARQADRSARQRIKALETELEQSKRSAMTEHERALAEAVEAAKSEAEASWAGRYLRLRVERLAATRMADPADATRLLDVEELEAETPDETIGKLLDALLEAKPYLAATGRAGATPPPVALDRGPRNGSAPPSADMNELLRQRR